MLFSRGTHARTCFTLRSSRGDPKPGYGGGRRQTPLNKTVFWEAPLYQGLLVWKRHFSWSLDYLKGMAVGREDALLLPGLFTIDMSTRSRLAELCSADRDAREAARPSDSI